MLKLLLNRYLKIGIFFFILVGVSGCGYLSKEKEYPIIGSINPPFDFGGEKAPAKVISRQDRFKKMPVPASGFITVQKGDTLHSIVNRYNVTPFKLISQNDLQAPFELIEGQVLKIVPRNTHTVRLGDSLFSISKQYSINQFEIAQLNELEEPFELYVGQTLQLPESKDFSIFMMETPKEPVLAIEIKPGTPAVVMSQKNVKSLNEKKFFVAPKLAVGDQFNWPLTGEIINRFGPAERGIHNDGVDIVAKFGADIQTTAPGTVAYIGIGLKSFGTLILVKHDGGMISAYAHLSEVLVSEGDVLSSGQVIGKVGQTGRVETPTLHFEIRQNRTPIDPASIIEL